MPIWFELIVFSIAAYVVGIGAGWLIWNRDTAPDGNASAADTPPSAQQA